jgi:hypothetical protein
VPWADSENKTLRCDHVAKPEHNQDDQRVLALEIVPGSDPIEGILRAPDGSKREFTGTLGLLAAIEALRERYPPSVSEPPDGND